MRWQFRGLALLTSTLRFFALIESTLAAEKGGASSYQKELMAKCNANSTDCNHRCDFTFRSGVLSKTGLSNCQDKCDTKFANCVGNAARF